MYTPTLVYPHTHHTHVYPCTHMHYTLTYTHAHTCMHTHIYTNAHTSHIYVPISHTRTQTHACLQKEPISLLAGRALWALLGTGAHAPSAPCARTRWGLLPYGSWALAGETQHASKTQGSGGVNSALLSSSPSAHHLPSLPGAARVETDPV